mmetsp:Transcript_20507/g.58311  ORF Transcript_20507/g.58311 Transcript_20507/m.58311 type:complete len:280 (+) Transcript_20507:1410-2249(+)
MHVVESHVCQQSVLGGSRGHGVGLVRLVRRPDLALVLDVEPVGLRLHLALHHDLVRPGREPMILPCRSEQFRRGAGDVNFVARAMGLQDEGVVHRLSEELESRLLSAKNARRDRATVQGQPDGQICRVRTQPDLELTHDFSHGTLAVARKDGHDDGVVRHRCWDASCSDVAIAQSFNLEYLPFLPDLVELIVQRLQEMEHLRRFTNARPGGKADQIGYEDGALWVVVCNGLRREHGDRVAWRIAALAAFTMLRWEIEAVVERIRMHLRYLALSYERDSE